MSVFALITVAVLGADPAAFDAFFPEFAQKRDGITGLAAQFIQTIGVPEERYTTGGTLVYTHPRRILFHTDDPDRTTMIEGRRGYEYEPEIKQLVIFDIEDNPRASIFFLGFDNDTASLRASYDVSLFTSSDDTRGSRGILIKPKADDDKPYFIEVRLHLRDQDYLPYRIHIVNDEESQTTIDIKDFTVNVPPDPGKIQINAAEGTKVIENDEVLEIVGPGGKRFPEDKKAAAEDAAPAVQVNELPPPPPPAQGTP